ncbi:UNVERIFIED_CONTAM: hypothetical protein Slati_3708200 [Sesamum latifolium]|uniref:Uncharacterized protein n=1 Tax=Sesamum latifolium TaxID=2727402 RepID=A0AAW2U1T1_9LAMI
MSCKKSDEYQQEVAKIAIPFLEYGFNACKDQFMAQRYPPTGEEPSFLDVKTALLQVPNPFSNTPTPVEKDPPQECGSEGSPPVAATDSVVGDILDEGGPEAKEEGVPPAPKGDSFEVPPGTSSDIPEGVPLAVSKGQKTRKTSPMWKRIDDVFAPL